MGRDLRILCAFLLNTFSLATTALAAPIDIPSYDIKKGVWEVAVDQEIEGQVARAPIRLTGAGCHDAATLIRDTLAPAEKLGCKFVLFSQRNGSARYEGTCAHLGQGGPAKMLIESGSPSEVLVTISSGKDRVTTFGRWYAECLQDEPCFDISNKE
jgi:hypothetical protein